LGGPLDGWDEERSLKSRPVRGPITNSRKGGRLVLNCASTVRYFQKRFGYFTTRLDGDIGMFGPGPLPIKFMIPWYLGGALLNGEIVCMTDSSAP
jgi:hypothetical protein